MAVEWDIGQILRDAAPEIVKVAGNVIGAEIQAGDNNAASRNFGSGAQASADILKGGYDAQLTNLEEGSDYLRGVIGAGLTDTTNILQGSADTYQTDLGNNAAEYGKYMVPQFDDYGNLVMNASDAFQADYQPYLETGQAANDYTAAAMASDPSVMTPAQTRELEQYHRDALARLAASGLRGAGRGGVAAVNEGDAALRAGFYGQNQSRADAAANTLGQRGFQATGTTASNTQEAKRNVAGTGFALASDIGNKGLAAANTGAQAQYTTGQNVANLTGQFYGNLADIEGGRFQSRADTSFGKAVADASAKGAATEMNAATDITNSNLRGTATGQISTVLSDAAKKSMQNDTIIGGSGNDVLIG